MNTVELPPGESIPEHDESGRDHEELFLVLDGDAVIVVEGVDHPLRHGSFARLDPALRADGAERQRRRRARPRSSRRPIHERLRALEWA